MNRRKFRQEVFGRDGGVCVVPWCKTPAEDAHHILERGLWDEGGYFPENGASVCDEHHRAAEENDIPPQAFWRWVGIDEPTYPDGIEPPADKWGEPFDAPPWKEHRDRIKYPSTGHLPFSPEWDDTRADFGSVDSLIGIPLVVTLKMDGGNAMLVKDTDEPVRARNGAHADHESFDRLKKRYWDENVYENLPGHLQVFGENLYAKHSIHYGCDCEPPCDDVGPPVRDTFQVFGVYDTRHDLWLSWDETRRLASKLGFRTALVMGKMSFDNENQFYGDLNRLAEHCVDDGHEGVIVRSRYPFHYGQFGRYVAKYVREGHVDPDAKHWSHRPIVENDILD